ncbi:radical SAM protein [Hylemonella gracilis]|uniref:Radical SAM protein n=1 Tax=Hylemonella gracilis TaxID=80880 RepID=A0A4P6UQQ6_9BURK|nr:PA0069 family radical SAM protein [Hylemonella gracilis]QBK06071.1 radical SAM protein [Hylemonella gracilis]
MDEFQIPLRAIKGRGVATRNAHRFEKLSRTAFDDGWSDMPVADDRSSSRRATSSDPAPTEPVAAVAEPAPPPTEVRWEDARSALARNDSPDLPFSQSINPYRGCEHGCSYCYARPTHSYLNLSPGLDFERIIIAKRGLAERLREEISSPSYKPSLIVIGSATDCYQPVEREFRLTRALIEVLGEARHPFALITKSSTVERDLDLLAPLAQAGLAAVHITITTLDAALTRKMEPRAASPQRRLRTIRTLAAAGVPVGVSVAPQIPFINEDMEQVLAAAAQAGARSAFYSVLRLPWELNDIFQQWLQTHYPDRAERVMARLREMRGGRDYDGNFATRMNGSGAWAELIAQRFQKACARHGLMAASRPLRTMRIPPTGAKSEAMAMEISPETPLFLTPTASESGGPTANPHRPHVPRYAPDFSQFRPGLAAGQASLF